MTIARIFHEDIPTATTPTRLQDVTGNFDSRQNGSFCPSAR